MTILQKTTFLQEYFILNKQMMHRLIIPFFLTLACTAACVHPAGSDDPAPEEILARMRADSSWIRELDSLAAEAIGPGARCIDPVWHLFGQDGRKWLFNQDWGGVLEIPSGYIPEDDLWQAELSFHGTRAFSPDSMVVISFYAGFQAIGNEELADAIRKDLDGDGFAIEHMDVDDREFRITARSAGGIHYYARYLFADGDGVEYAAGVQFPAGRENEAEEIIRMIQRFPLGPGGRPFRGLALQ